MVQGFVQARVVAVVRRIHGTPCEVLGFLALGEDDDGEGNQCSLCSQSGAMVQRRHGKSTVVLRAALSRLLTALSKRCLWRASAWSIRRYRASRFIRSVVAVVGAGMTASSSCNKVSKDQPSVLRRRLMVMVFGW